MNAQIIRGNALALPLADNSVDLVVTSPPYFGLRSYRDGGAHYEGQIGDEATPAEFVDALVAATAEMVRVTKPTGSIFVNLGDKYVADNRGSGTDVKRGAAKHAPRGPLGFVTGGMRQKSLMGIPWRYALRCIDELGLILRAEIVWAKPNAMPDSAKDRVGRAHEHWFHLTAEPYYFANIEPLREKPAGYQRKGGVAAYTANGSANHGLGSSTLHQMNPLGRLPGSVWSIPTEPLHVPDHVGVDHFAAYPTEWPRRIIQGWSPSGICTECGEGRRPVIEKGEACACLVHPDGTDPTFCVLCLSGEHRRRLPPTRPALVLDPFGGTGTTALVAEALGRNAVHVDMSADYCRLARWRTTDPKQKARAARREFVASPEPIPGQTALFEETA